MHVHVMSMSIHAHVRMNATARRTQIEQRTNVPMYRTALPNTRVGPFGGTLVVSMRPCVA
jgi:uncharacterized protein YcsI (UPF0317 family)